MFLPLGDSPNPRGFTPWVTHSLIVANVLVFLALWPLAWRPADPRDPAFVQMVRTIAEERGIPRGDWPALARQLAETSSAYDLLVFRRGFRPASPSWLAVLSSMFLHGGLLHLLGNMLFLWIYGDNVEHRLGRAGFLAAYLATGIAATAGDGILRFGSDIPSVGASGAISGVLGLYFSWFPHNRVRLAVFLPFALIFELPARVVLGMYLVVDNVLPWLLAGAQSDVSYGAHIGGFLAGWVVAARLSRRSLGSREPDLRIGGMTVERNHRSEAFRSALEAGRLGEASGLLFDGPRGETRSELAAGDKIRLGDALLDSDHPRAALAAYQRALADHPRDPARGRAHLGAARALMGPLGMTTAAYQHLYSAMEEPLTGEDRALARRLLAELEARSASVPRGLPG